MDKSPEAFRTISEVAEWLDTPAHVLRFWESKFAQVKPIKRAGGRRYYRPADMALLGGLKKLLHEDGLSIKGAQALLREQGVRHVAALSQPLEGEDAAADFEVSAEAVEDAAPAARISGVPPLTLEPTEEDAAAAEAETPEDASGREQPELPFLHRAYEEHLPQEKPGRTPLLRSGAEALDAAAPAPEAAEAMDLPEPAPLAVPRLDRLRAALQDAGTDAQTRARVAERLGALRKAIAEDRTA